MAIRIPVMRSITRSRRERNEDGSPRRFAPRNDVVDGGWFFCLSWAIVLPGRRFLPPPYRLKVGLPSVLRKMRWTNG